ncbi:TVP38/TMEM64 family protein [Hymenobacter cellulosivorans]|uniref:TVP38/TMEM64 family membrane protein n=1 Tax=Hymenobacter cellulosivorans TaxID=2932249 RepID=A0ABY4FA19_9BACT|nr:VTT domain-containing protein [Hymenobacter cellulosivorans]UOQ53026.1 VTT domain-containing protein [Hymenobacter cellulosivorans]
MAFFKELLQKNASTLLSMGMLVAMPVVGSASLTFLLYQYQDLLQHLSLGQVLLYFVVIGVTMAFALTPTTFVALVTGFYFDWAGLPGMVIAYALAALVGYEVASRLDHGKMTTFLHHFPKADAVMRELKNESLQLIILTRISPVLPFALMTFVLAVMRIDRRRFLLGSVVGMLPRSLFFYWLGTKAQDVVALVNNPDTGTAGKLLLIGLIIISLFGLYYVFNRALKRALSRSSAG